MLPTLAFSRSRLSRTLSLKILRTDIILSPKTISTATRLHQVRNHLVSKSTPPRRPPSIIRTMATTLTQAQSHFLADLDPPVCSLDVQTAFDGLTNDERHYAYWMAKASWAGARIIMEQWTSQAQSIHDLLITIFSSSADKSKIADLKALKGRSGVADGDWKEVLSYAAQVFSNLTNYKSFGDTKFIPRASSSTFEKVVQASERKDEALLLWNKLKEEIYSLEPEPKNHVGKPIAGHVSNYYPNSPDIADDEVAAVQALCDKEGISTVNTRLTKNSPTEFTLLIASSSSSPHPKGSSLTSSSQPAFTLHLKTGDHSPSLSASVKALQEAQKYAKDPNGKINENRRDMLLDYAKSFETGDIDDHKEGSRKWVKDVGPVVETYIGFIENYVDPYASRAEWEGFVAVVNKEMSKKFETLVNQAPELIKTLPWGKDFEVDTFRRPDFTSLEILSFATGGIPAGINIPNFFDIREELGFKNVSLQNILAATAPNEELPFLTPEDVELWKKWNSKAFEIQVANHELLGHGSGKDLKENADGTFNFDPKTVLNPLTGKPVTSWYKPGETYNAKIGQISAAMEECRAEAVALYLCSNRDILSIFGLETEEDIETAQYMTFLIMARAGLRALEFFDPKTGKHGQAHMQARLAITNWLIADGIVAFEEVRSKDQKLEDIIIKVDKNAVLTKGRESMGKLLVEIQVRKSTADSKGATEFFTKTSTPREGWSGEVRDLVLARKQPRKIFVQPNLFINDKDEVILKDYPTTNEGLIESFVERQL